MSAFFAIEIDAFPVDENGKLGLDYVLKYMRRSRRTYRSKELD